MRLRTAVQGVACVTVTAALIGCQDVSRDTGRATIEVQALYERSVELQRRIAEAGQVTDADRREVVLLQGAIAAWNARYDIDDVRIGGEDLEVKEPEVFANQASGPIVPTPGRGCDGWSCADSFSESGFLFLKVCHLVKSICYTDGQLDCEYHCTYFPKWLIQPA